METTTETTAAQPEPDARFVGKNPLVGRWQWQALPETLAGARWAARQHAKPLGLIVLWLTFGAVAGGAELLNMLRATFDAGVAPQIAESGAHLPTWFLLLQHGLVFLVAVLVVCVLLLVGVATPFRLGLTVRPRVPGRAEPAGYAFADVIFLAKILGFAAVGYLVVAPIILTIFREAIAPYLNHMTTDPVKVLHLAVLAPIGEELFFRGVLYTGLRREFRPWEAGIFSALLFAVTHAVFQWEGIPTHINHLIGGFVFAYVYERTGTLWPGMILHAAGNTSVWVLGFLAPMVGLL